MAEASDSPDSRAPLLSLFVGARNDAYMGDSRWRLETTINYLGENLERLQRQDSVELVVCDWGSAQPLHAVLNLTPAGRRIVRFILVPASMARRYAIPENDWPMALLQNVAVRRCRGRFIGQTDSDMLFPAPTLRRILALADGGCVEGVETGRGFFFAGRRHVPTSYVAMRPPLHEISWVVRRYGRALPENPWFWFVGRAYTGTGLVLMHRDLWSECRGYDERMVFWGSVDLNLAARALRRSPWVDMTRRGFELYHLNHHGPGGAAGPSRVWNPRKFDGLPFCPNGPDWGLGDRTFEEFVYPVEPAPSVPRPAGPSAPRWDWSRFRHLLPALLTAPLRQTMTPRAQSSLWYLEAQLRARPWYRALSVLPDYLRRWAGRK
ncbi:MAG: hypothetical protein HYY17_14055 [Planctomycetes bacterium]|nr:hypothetical protein [Planctomycetota bacterium]